MQNSCYILRTVNSEDKKSVHQKREGIFTKRGMAEFKQGIYRNDHDIIENLWTATWLYGFSPIRLEGTF